MARPGDRKESGQGEGTISGLILGSMYQHTWLLCSIKPGCGLCADTADTTAVCAVKINRVKNLHVCPLACLATGPMVSRFDRTDGLPWSTRRVTARHTTRIVHTQRALSHLSHSV